MRCVQTLAEIRQNILTLDRYLEEKHSIEYLFALNLIKKGICSIAVKVESGYRFYPSRFTGYTGNCMDRHLNNQEKDGRITTPALSKVLGQPLAVSSCLDRVYKSYCERLGFVANDKGTYGVQRKFWELNQSP